MSFDALMIHQCIIERVPENGEDSHGNAPGDQVPERIYNGMCRYVEKSTRVLDQTGAYVSVQVSILLIPTGIEVRMKDMVASLVCEDGSEFIGAFKVRQVVIRRGHERNHLSLELERVQ